MPKSKSGSSGRGRVLTVGGARVHLIKAANKKPPVDSRTVRPRAVVVPSGSYDADKFPAVERLRAERLAQAAGA